MNNEKGKALSYNEGKNMLDLISPFVEQEIGKVLTYGAIKYERNNHLIGMSWHKSIGSMMRHINAFRRGEDIDAESGCYHLAQAIVRATFILDYYKTYPQGDDRPHRYLIHNRIGLDIDGVIADFVGAMMNKYPNELTNRPIYWNDPILRDKFKQVVDDEDFWLSVEPMVTELPFEPICYITARQINNNVTQKWLDMNGFPSAPLIQVSNNKDKYEAAKKYELDMFVDDNFEVFSTMNRNGLLCYLFDAPYNTRYDVGFKRITDLKDIVTYI